MNETIKPHPEFGGLILVSDRGRVFRAPRPTTKQDLPAYEYSQRRHHKNRYWLVQFEIGGRNHTRLVHTLVLETFVGPRPSPDHEACHGPLGNVSNALSNLRWDTKEANLRDAATARGMLDPLAQ
jgi:hypothetical protein